MTAAEDRKRAQEIADSQPFLIHQHTGGGVISIPAELAASLTPEQIEALRGPVPSNLSALREPFPPSQVGLLPQPYKKDAVRGTCDVCGKYHGLPAMHLDYVGHGAVTHRLLEVDPEWTWEPMAYTPEGLPALDRYGNLWIRLTVLGVTRIGVGDGASMKVLIGDALRNAAMRFGVALDLWMRGDGVDEKAEGEESIPEPAFEWTAGAVKARLIELLPSKEAAVEAWRNGHGDDLTEWSSAVADRLAHDWLDNQPVEEGDPGPESE